MKYEIKSYELQLQLKSDFELLQLSQMKLERACKSCRFLQHNGTEVKFNWIGFTPVCLVWSADCSSSTTRYFGTMWWLFHQFLPADVADLFGDVTFW